MINNKMLAVGACFCLLSGAQTSRADFALNWAPDAVNRFGDNTLPYVNCNRGEQNVNCIDQSARISPIQDPDKTPFLQERVIGSDGQVYYHVIVGLPTSTFAQETFIRAGGALNWGAGFINVQGSSAGGTVTFAPSNAVFSSSQLFTTQKPLDADETISGNSTGNPTRVVMRQINNDGEFSQEFFKDSLLNKPRISQSINNADMSTQFIADMRGISYTDSSTAAPLINTLTLPGAGGFNMATDAQASHVTAGQYVWVPGAGPDQSSGTYQYSEGGYDPYLENWKAFRRADQNVIKNP